MNRKLFFYSVCLLFIVKECTTAVILTQVPEAVEENDGLQLLCTVPVSDLSTTVSFLKDGAQKGQCTAPLPGVAPGSCASNIEQDIQTGVTTYNISAATNAELGSWSCELGVQPSNQLDVLIVVRGALTNNQWNLPSVISDNAELLNVEIGCCYPQPSVQWKKQICSQTDLTNVATNPNVMVNGSVSCTLPKKAYTSSLPVRNIANPSKQTCYKPKAEISYSTNLPTDASTFTSEVIIEGSTSSQPGSDWWNCLFIVIGSVCGIIIILYVNYRCSNRNCKTHAKCWKCSDVCYSDYPLVTSEEWNVEHYCCCLNLCCPIEGCNKNFCSCFLCGGCCLIEFPEKRSDNDQQGNNTKHTNEDKAVHTATVKDTKSEPNPPGERGISLNSLNLKSNKILPEEENNTKIFDPIMLKSSNVEIAHSRTPRPKPVLPPIDKKTS